MEEIDKKGEIYQVASNRLSPGREHQSVINKVA
jgi:hypothetical protein